MYGDDISATRGILDDNGNGAEVHVRAPLEDAVAALMSIFPGSTRHKEIDTNRFRLSGDGCFVAQLKGHSWTVVTGFNSSHSFTFEAQQLSEKLKTRALFFAQSDTVGAVFYDFFENGLLLEKLMHCDEEYSEKQNSLKSNFRDVNRDEFMEDPWAFVDQFIAQQDLLVTYLPEMVLVPVNAKIGSKVSLPLGRETTDHFIQIDYLELGTGN